MPKDYSKGKIYMLVCNITGNVYYGSTTYKYLSQRLRPHKASYECWLNGKGPYTTSFEILKNNDYDMILVELYPCSCIEELTSRERFYIKNNECVNKNLPIRTPEDELEWHRNYRNQNKDHINTKAREYYHNDNDIVVCECGASVKKQCLRKHLQSSPHEVVNQQHKQYREKNKDKLTQQRKEYYTSNKAQLLKNQRDKITCECGVEICKGGLAEHKKSMKHQKLLNLPITSTSNNNKEYQKEYAENNKEKLAEYQKQYHEKNKEKIAQQRKEYYEKLKSQKHLSSVNKV